MYDSVQIRKTFIQTGMFMIMMINVHCTRTLFSEIFFFQNSYKFHISESWRVRSSKLIITRWLQNGQDI